MKFVIKNCRVFNHSGECGEDGLCQDVCGNECILKRIFELCTSRNSEGLAKDILLLLDTEVVSINKTQLITELKKLQDIDDEELAHIEADKLLLAHINDEEVTEQFVKINKYYS